LRRYTEHEHELHGYNKQLRKWFQSRVSLAWRPKLCLYQ
jgi:hypothetical protein